MLFRSLFSNFTPAGFFNAILSFSYSRHNRCSCINCQNCPIESVVHLVFLCPYAVAVWFHIVGILGKPIFKIASSVHDVWQNSWEMVKVGGYMSKKEWSSRFICTIWHIWKRRNNAFFRDQRTEAQPLAFKIILEMDLWFKNS